jgi:hypothetical protein
MSAEFPKRIGRPPPADKSHPHIYAAGNERIPVVSMVFYLSGAPRPTANCLSPCAPVPMRACPHARLSPCAPPMRAPPSGEIRNMDAEGSGLLVRITALAGDLRATENGGRNGHFRVGSISPRFRLRREQGTALDARRHLSPWRPESRQVACPFVESLASRVQTSCLSLCGVPLWNQSAWFPTNVATCWRADPSSGSVREASD